MRDTAGSTHGPAITVDALHKSYGSVHALKGVAFTVERGEFFGILGPNGAGKTTLVEIMEGLRAPGDGKVSVLGHSPWPRDTGLLPLIGIQTQASAFFLRLTALEHLETVAGLYGLGRDRARAALTMVGLDDKADAATDKLSGGQRQRLAIAAALVHEPELIFLDEPTAALDPQSRRDLWDLLRDIKGQGRTIVYTTHHLEEAEALCDRVAIVRDGTLLALDTPARLVRSLDAPTRVLVPADLLAPERARQLPGADEVTAEGSSTVITTRSVGEVLGAVGAIAGLQDVETRRASLEDVYLKLTGTEYQA
ncbi:MULTISPECIES: ABC transporter ATP-binding protein [Streptomyces]|uniref:ABC transporter ATP-binding protein n=1 Tax=Streptomyces TaxID=1883 RepID=UPI001C30D039|nr:ABC transporter ATP-binding protein [Streptomyces sp. GbtcB7]